MINAVVMYRNCSDSNVYEYAMCNVSEMHWLLILLLCESDMCEEAMCSVSECNVWTLSCCEDIKSYISFSLNQVQDQVNFPSDIYSFNMWAFLLDIYSFIREPFCGIAEYCK